MTKTKTSTRKGNRKPKIVLCCVFSILCSVLLVVGRAVYETNRLHTLWDTPSRLGGTLAALLATAAGTACLSALSYFALGWLAGLFSPGSGRRPGRAVTQSSRAGSRAGSHAGAASRSAGSAARASGRQGPKPFLLFWLLSFASWIPAFLAYDPGIMAYDTYPQSRQALEGFSGMNKYHPPLHTMFWAACIRAGALLHIDATLIYEFLQMLMLSFAFAVMLRYMVRRRCHPFVIACSALFVILNPVIAIFSLEMVKDSCVAIFLILVTVRLAELSDAIHRQNTAPLSVGFWLSLAFLTAVLCLLRNNAVYAVILSLPFMLILARGFRVQVLATLAAALVAFGAINGPVYHALGIQEGNSREMLSVPILQITTVVVNHGFEGVAATQENGAADDGTATAQENGAADDAAASAQNDGASNGGTTSTQDSAAAAAPLTAQDYEAIGRFLPCDKLPEVYNPRFADLAKNSFDSQYFDDHKGEFVKLWLGLFKRYPEEFWSAFLDLNIQLWYPGSAAVDPYAEREYIETGVYEAEYCSGVRKEHFPRLLAFYEGVADYSPWMDTPGLSVLFAFWTPVWLFVTAFFVLAARGRLEKTLILFIPFFLWFTYLAGPVTCTRYVFPMMVLYPLIVSTLFTEI